MPPAVPYGQVPTGATNGQAIAGLVCGIVGLFFCGPVLGIAALILGSLGLQKAKELGGTGHGMAVAALVLGVIDMIVTILLFIWLVET